MCLCVSKRRCHGDRVAAVNDLRPACDIAALVFMILGLSGYRGLNAVEYCGCCGRHLAGGLFNNDAGWYWIIKYNQIQQKQASN